jgi:hypothetical protein
MRDCRPSEYLSILSCPGEGAPLRRLTGSLDVISSSTPSDAVKDKEAGERHIEVSDDLHGLLGSYPTHEGGDVVQLDPTIASHLLSMRHGQGRTLHELRIVAFVSHRIVFFFLLFDGNAIALSQRLKKGPHDLPILTDLERETERHREREDEMRKERGTSQGSLDEDLLLSQTRMALLHPHPLFSMALQDSVDREHGIHHRLSEQQNKAKESAKEIRVQAK